MTARALRISVIVVTRHRPDALSLCLAGLAQQDHPDFEVIVVACPAGSKVAARYPVKSLPFGQANISAARNLGLMAAAAPLVAFIDDDAVPEPTWLTRLSAVFGDNNVHCAGGFVRGRSGMAFQWKASTVDGFGNGAPLTVDETNPSLHPAPQGGAIKTEGTNCAFRTDLLRAIGGFDPGFRFFLDETDVNMRMAARGGLTAIVPMAQVHHGFAPSMRRAIDRAPRDLFDIGASSALFWRKHAPGDDHSAAEAELITNQRARLLRHMISGGSEPRDIGRLLNGLRAGLAAGRAAQIAPLPALPAATATFQPFPSQIRTGRVIAGRIWQAAGLMDQAARAAADGDIVTLILLSPTLRPHQMRFTPDGYWLQRGGLWGQGFREHPRPPLAGFRQRIHHECEILAALRPIH